MSIVDKFGEKVGEIAEKILLRRGSFCLQDIDYRKKISIISGQKASNVRAVCGKDCHE